MSDDHSIIFETHRDFEEPESEEIDLQLRMAQGRIRQLMEEKKELMGTVTELKEKLEDYDSLVAEWRMMRHHLDRLTIKNTGLRQALLAGVEAAATATASIGPPSGRTKWNTQR